MARPLPSVAFPPRTETGGGGEKAGRRGGEGGSEQRPGRLPHRTPRRPPRAGSSRSPRRPQGAPPPLPARCHFTAAGQRKAAGPGPMEPLRSRPAPAASTPQRPLLTAPHPPPPPAPAANGRPRLSLARTPPPAPAGPSVALAPGAPHATPLPAGQPAPPAGVLLLSPLHALTQTTPPRVTYRVGRAPPRRDGGGGGGPGRSPGSPQPRQGEGAAPVPRVAPGERRPPVRAEEAVVRGGPRPRGPAGKAVAEEPGMARWAPRALESWR
ncbi:basic proline-rich protein-like [Strigops habroptila]|uniref:basic proline-rich protein-like n=1 Tax=Strigops habroptila TaxID=2489341 RepID=UPI0011CF477B|nr:basic proline-rich protein-like [Strigops habroptila]